MGTVMAVLHPLRNGACAVFVLICTKLQLTAAAYFFLAIGGLYHRGFVREQEEVRQGIYQALRHSSNTIFGSLQHSPSQSRNTRLTVFVLFSEHAKSTGHKSSHRQKIMKK